MTGHQADSQLVHTHTNVPVVYDCIGHIIATSGLWLASPLTGHASILTIISATQRFFLILSRYTQCWDLLQYCWANLQEYCIQTNSFTVY